MPCLSQNSLNVVVWFAEDHNGRNSKRWHTSHSAGAEGDGRRKVWPIAMSTPLLFDVLEEDVCGQTSLSRLWVHTSRLDRICRIWCVLENFVSSFTAHEDSFVDTGDGPLLGHEVQEVQRKRL